MKGILKFNLSDKDEREAHLRAVRSTDLASALFEISCNLRRNVNNPIKDEHFHAVTEQVIDSVFEKIESTLNDHNLNMNELIS